MSGCIYQVVYVYAISRPMVQTTVTYWSPTAINQIWSQPHLPGDNYLMQHEILVVHIASHYRS